MYGRFMEQRLALISNKFEKKNMENTNIHVYCLRFHLFILVYIFFNHSSFLETQDRNANEILTYCFMS